MKRLRFFEPPDDIAETYTSRHFNDVVDETHGEMGVLSVYKVVSSSSGEGFFVSGINAEGDAIWACGIEPITEYSDVDWPYFSEWTADGQTLTLVVECPDDVVVIQLV